MRFNRIEILFTESFETMQFCFQLFHVLLKLFDLINSPDNMQLVWYRCKINFYINYSNRKLYDMNAELYNPSALAEIEMSIYYTILWVMIEKGVFNNISIFFNQLWRTFNSQPVMRKYSLLFIACYNLKLIWISVVWKKRF